MLVLGRNPQDVPQIPLQFSVLQFIQPFLISFRKHLRKTCYEPGMNLSVRCNLKLALYAEGKARPKKEADHSRLIGDRFNNQRNLHTRLVLGSCNTSRSLHPSSRTLKGYTEDFMGFSHVSSPDIFNSTLLFKVFILETSSYCGKGGQNVIPRTGEGVRSLWLPRASSRAK